LFHALPPTADGGVLDQQFDALDLDPAESDSQVVDCGIGKTAVASAVVTHAGDGQLHQLISSLMPFSEVPLTGHVHSGDWETILVVFAKCSSTNRCTVLSVMA
jgi:hypothetical protein